ncbi:hypothetical protein DSM112329_00250 [Paraconexibacter sp. AEG42_29]|uniref:Beta-lactamase-related domain-containing protein n=1 Tax=Paraconexibacter sp. AEG42_29 TaxID=2997339 RepID=A0AAU7AP58_9ACTN
MPPAARHDPGLQTLVDAVHGRGDLPAAAVCVLDGDADLVAWAGAGAAVDPALRVRVASITKTVTALTVHRLVAAGGLRLDDPLAAGGGGTGRGGGTGHGGGGGSEREGGASGSEGGKGADTAGATVADLLSHTAGLPLELAGVDWLTGAPPDAAALAGRIAAAGLCPMRSPFRYSNVGFWWLDGVLRRATGEPTEVTAAATLAALPNAGGIGFGEADLAGHLLTARGRLVRHVAPFAPARRASGGLTADLPSIAWLGRGLLEALATTPALREPRAEIADGWGWTAGLERWTTAGRVLLGHHGSWGGTRTLMVLDPADRRVAVACVTSEAGNPALRTLLSAIGLPAATPERPAHPAPLPLGAFADGVATATLVADDRDPDGLLLQAPAGGAPQRARRLAPGLARLLDGPHAGEALTTPDGRVLRLGVRSLDPLA